MNIRISSLVNILCGTESKQKGKRLWLTIEPINLNMDWCYNLNFKTACFVFYIDKKNKYLKFVYFWFLFISNGRLFE